MVIQKITQALRLTRYQQIRVFYCGGILNGNLLNMSDKQFWRGCLIAGIPAVVFILYLLLIFIQTCRYEGKPRRNAVVNLGLLSG